MKKLLIAIPAYNEEKILENNILKLNLFLSQYLADYDCRIVINNNSSTDGTGRIAEKLSRELPGVICIHHPFRSMSRSIQRTWLCHEADVYAHIDADLSADLANLPRLLERINAGANIATGSRMTDQSIRTRKIGREILSVGLIKIVQALFSTSIQDFQCGFKAIDRRVRDEIIPKMKCTDHGLMSTEMILVAIQKGLNVQEIPIVWSDTRNTKTNLVWSIYDAVCNLYKIKLRLIFGKYN